MGRCDFWDRKDINRATHTMMYNRWQLEAGKNSLRKGRDNLYRYWEAQAFVLYERDLFPRKARGNKKGMKYKKRWERPPKPVKDVVLHVPERTRVVWEPPLLTWD